MLKAFDIEYTNSEEEGVLKYMLEVKYYVFLNSSAIAVERIWVICRPDALALVNYWNLEAQSNKSNRVFALE